jgi:hypothetical protein
MNSKSGRREKDIRAAFTALMPLAPFADAEPIRRRAGRRSMADLPAETAVWLAAVAHVRHMHTDYDALLDEGYDRDSARHFVLAPLNAKLTEWRASRYVSAEEDFPPDDETGDDQD